MVEVIYVDEVTAGGGADDRSRIRRWLANGLDRDEIEAEVAELEEQRRQEEGRMQDPSQDPTRGSGDASSGSVFGPEDDFGKQVDPAVREALGKASERKARVRQRIQDRHTAMRPRSERSAPPSSKPPIHPDVPAELRERWERAPYEPLPPETSPERGPVPFPMLGQPYKPPPSQ